MAAPSSTSPAAITDPKQITAKPSADVEQGEESLSLQRLYMTRLVGDTAWSPDNQQIAVLGYGVYCPQPQGQYVPGLVNVYDGHSAKLLAQIRRYQYFHLLLQLIPRDPLRTEFHHLHAF